MTNSDITLNDFIQHVLVIRDGAVPGTPVYAGLNARLTALRVFADTGDPPDGLWGALPLREALDRICALSTTDAPEGVQKNTFITYACRAVQAIREYLGVPVRRRRKKEAGLGAHQSNAPTDTVTSLLRLIGAHGHNTELQLKLAEVLVDTLKQSAASRQPGSPSPV